MINRPHLARQRKVAGVREALNVVILRTFEALPRPKSRFSLPTLPLLLCLFLTILLLSACSLTAVDLENSNHFRPPAGTIIQLNVDLVVSANNAKAYVQGGERKANRSAVDRFLPWCEFRVKRSLDARRRPFIISKSNLKVISSHRGIDYSAIERARAPVLLAGRDRILWPAHSEVSMENMATVMKIESEQQPELMSLDCMTFTDALFMNHLTLSEIRNTLGDIATIKLAGG